MPRPTKSPHRYAVYTRIQCTHVPLVTCASYAPRAATQLRSSTIADQSGSWLSNLLAPRLQLTAQNTVVAVGQHLLARLHTCTSWRASRLALKQLAPCFSALLSPSPPSRSSYRRPPGSPNIAGNTCVLKKQTRCPHPALLQAHSYFTAHTCISEIHPPIRSWTHVYVALDMPVHPQRVLAAYSSSQLTHTHDWVFLVATTAEITIVLHIPPRWPTRTLPTFNCCPPVGSQYPASSQVSADEPRIPFKRSRHYITPRKHAQSHF